MCDIAVINTHTLWQASMHTPGPAIPLQQLEVSEIKPHPHHTHTIIHVTLTPGCSSLPKGFLCHKGEGGIFGRGQGEMADKWEESQSKEMGNRILKQGDHAKCWVGIIRIKVCAREPWIERYYTECQNHVHTPPWWVKSVWSQANQVLELESPVLYI